MAAIESQINLRLPLQWWHLFKTVQFLHTDRLGWNMTISGFDFDQFVVMGMSQCIVGLQISSKLNESINTGSAVALHCRKAYAKINRKMGNSTRPPCKIVTPKNIILKLCTRDYVGEMTRHANFGSYRYSGGFSPNRRNITTLWLCWLSCPCFFFSGTRPGRTAEPIFTLYGSNDVFPHKDGPFGG